MPSEVAGTIEILVEEGDVVHGDKKPDVAPQGVANDLPAKEEACLPGRGTCSKW